METLIPRERYDLDETGYWRRLPALSGVTAVVLNTLLVFGLTLLIDPGNLQYAFIMAIGTSLFGGVVFAAFFPRLLRRHMLALVNSAYAGDPSVIGTPPPSEAYTYRLLANWMKTDHLAVPGILYLGCTGVQFVPHRQNLRRHGQPFEITPLEQLSFSLVEPRLNWLFRLYHTTTPRYIEITWPTGRARFAVPSSTETLQEVQKRVSKLLNERPVR